MSKIFDGLTAAERQLITILDNPKKPSLFYVLDELKKREDKDKTAASAYKKLRSCPEAEYEGLHTELCCWFAEEVLLISCKY